MASYTGIRICKNHYFPYLHCQAPARLKKKFSSEKVQAFPSDALSEIKNLMVEEVEKVRTIKR